MSLRFKTAVIARRANAAGMALALLAVYPSSASLCQSNSNDRTGADSRTVRAVVDAMAKRFELDVRAEPALARIRLESDIQGDTLEACLTSLAAKLRIAAWRLVATTERVGSAEDIAVSTRAISTISGSLGTSRGLKDPVRILFHAKSRPDNLSKTIYILYSTAMPPDGLTVSERCKMVDNDLLELSAELPPGDRVNPMAAWVQALQPHDKETIEAAMRPVGDAGMALWERTSPEQRDSMIRDGMSVMQSFGSGQPRSTIGAAGRAGVNDAQALLESAAKRLGRKWNSQILVEPEMAPASGPPTGSDDSTTVDQALDRLIASSRGLIWRRVYVPEDSVIDRRFVRTMADEVRSIDSLMVPEITLKPRKGEAESSFSRTAAGDEASVLLEQAGLRKKPLFLILRRSKVSALNPRDRYAEAMRKQMESILSMDSDQLADVMGQAIQSYQSAGGAQRMDIMGLPSMAAMLGAWMPRAAKERAGGRP